MQIHLFFFFYACVPHSQPPPPCSTYLLPNILRITDFWRFLDYQRKKKKFLTGRSIPFSLCRHSSTFYACASAQPRFHSLLPSRPHSLSPVQPAPCLPFPLLCTAPRSDMVSRRDIPYLPMFRILHQKEIPNGALSFGSCHNCRLRYP